eukprot:TRINITY_DN1418_c0_g1_i13.p1 TRINITY_DN1418_c0_g1~~TRINITY_DN1418_c0_g1_i13.p1  ORF type:complete len:125 (-),score=38.70 TRINITY_DN1418_c0_g1_i13:38-412(-)
MTDTKAEKPKPSKEQVLKEAFDMTDIEGNEFIVPSKLGPALRSVGKRLTDDQMQAFQKDAEAKGGKIKFEDFKAYVEEASKKEKSYDDIEYAFKVFAKESKDTKEIGRAVQQECRDRSRMPSSA